jgi:hypothetical protein
MLATLSLRHPSVDELFTAVSSHLSTIFNTGIIGVIAEYAETLPDPVGTVVALTDSSGSSISRILEFQKGDEITLLELPTKLPTKASETQIWKTYYNDKEDNLILRGTNKRSEKTGFFPARDVTVKALTIQTLRTIPVELRPQLTPDRPRSVSQTRADTCLNLSTMSVLIARTI